MAGSNQVPHGVPYGDIFSADTPVTDSTVSRLQAEERQRQQFQQQQDKNLDGIMDREFTKVRSVDTPEVLDAWNKYKALSKRTLFDKSLQNNSKEYNSVQQDKNAALADVYSKINASNDLQQRDKELIQSQRMHPERYASDFGGRMTARRNTPLSKLQSHPLGDLSNDNTMAYSGPITDFSSAYKKAEGDKKTVPFETTTPDGLQRRISTVSKKATPFEYYNNLLPQLVGSQKTNDFIRSNDKYTPEQEDNINTQFDVMMQDPEVKRKWGLQGNETFPTHQNPTPVERLAQLHAKEWALQNAPEETGVKYQPIVSAMDQMKLTHQKAIIDYKQGNTVSNIYLRNRLKKEQQDGKSLQDSNTLNDLVGGIIDDADKNPQTIHAGVGTSRTPYKELPVSTATLKLFPNKDDKGHNVDADKLLISTDKNHILARTYVRDNGEVVKDANGNPVIDETKSRMFTLPEFKTVIGKNLLGAKETNKQMATPKGVGAKSVKLPKNAFD